MAGEVMFDNLESFMSGISAIGISKVACAEVDEKRAVQTRENVLEVHRVKKLELLAYRDSIIYKCPVSNSDHKSVYDRLESHGFEIKVISRNIT